MRKRLNYFLKIFLILAALCLLVWFTFIITLLQQFSNIPPHITLRIKSDSLITNVTLIFPEYTYNNDSIGFVDCEETKCKIVSVKTNYGRMWRIEIAKIGKTEKEIEETIKELAEIGITEPEVGSGGVVSFHYIPKRPVDLFSIDLSPKLGSYIVKEERKGRHYTKVTNLTVPAYIEYVGNVTEVKVELIVESGLDNFLGLLPVAPKHDDDVYAGMREDVFLIDFKGWGTVVGTSKIDVTYQ